MIKDPRSVPVRSWFNPVAGSELGNDESPQQYTEEMPKLHMEYLVRMGLRRCFDGSQETQPHLLVIVIKAQKRVRCNF